MNRIIMNRIRTSLSKITIGFIASFFALINLSLIANAEEGEKVAIIRLSFTEEDGQKYITANLNEWAQDSIGSPIAEVDLYFYVERTFSLLPIGDIFNTTDENGEVTIEFPMDLPGDDHGNVVVIAKLEDAENYPDAEVSETIDWGIPTDQNPHAENRTLWSAGANAPLSLLFLTNSLIAIAWGIIFYIGYKLYRISRI